MSSWLVLCWVGGLDPGCGVGRIPQGNHIYTRPSIDTYDYSKYRPHAETHHEEKQTVSDLHRERQHL